jgi:tetrapyrrole methylase family protein / MazG family protein
MRVTVVGLGPGPRELLTVSAAEALRAPGAVVFARTRLHPALSGVEPESFDAQYDQASSLAEVEAEIVSRLLAVGSDVVLAVPGDGMLGESVLCALRAAGAEVVVVPGVPLGVGALAAVSLEGLDGAQLVEATALGGSGTRIRVELNPRWPAVATGVYSRAVASDLKLTLQHVYPADHALWVVHRPGLPEARVVSVSLADLDRVDVDFDHLTHVVLAPVPVEVPTGSAHGLRAIVARLRDPRNGCPWDLEQTHRSLTPYVVEEAYEVVDAIEDADPAGLAEELGDVLLQVALHAELADQSGEFDWNDVVRLLGAKLIRRHPHIFGEVQVSGASDVVRNWEVLKAAERGADRGTSSALDGVPRSLPGLKRAAEISRKAVEAGFEWPSRDGTLDKVREELDELLSATSVSDRAEELGDLLWILGKLAWQDGIDPEAALQAANKKFIARFQLLEQIAHERGWSRLSDPPFSELNDAWNEAKRRHRAASA